MLGTLPRRHERQFVGTGSPPPSYLQGVRSGATLFLLAAVGILAALALADALRPRTTRSPPPARPRRRRRPRGPSRRPCSRPCATRRSRASSSTRTRTAGSTRCSSRAWSTTSSGARTAGTSSAAASHVDRRHGSSPGARTPPASSRFATARSSPGDRVVLTHADLVRAARRHPNLSGYDRSIPLHIAVDDLASFGRAESGRRDDDLRPLPRAAVPARPLRRARQSAPSRRASSARTATSS